MQEVNTGNLIDGVGTLAKHPYVHGVNLMSSVQDLQNEHLPVSWFTVTPLFHVNSPGNPGAFHPSLAQAAKLIAAFKSRSITKPQLPHV